MLNLEKKRKFTLNLKDQLYSLDKPKIMGIVNLTPDSFYDKSRINSIDEFIKKIELMISEGADMIDIGAMSSRPYSHEISIEEELARVSILSDVLNHFPNQIFSIDTYRSEVAEFALKHGVSIINDISAGRKDERIVKLAIDYQAPLIAMHMQGSIESMQDNPHYDSILAEIAYFFSERIYKFYKKGLNDLILDPGFGFGKSLSDNYHLLKHLTYFSEFNCPLLVGISRKSMIYKPLEISPEGSLIGSSALHFQALKNGAHILRVHDVKEARQVIDLYSIYEQA